MCVEDAGEDVNLRGRSRGKNRPSYEMKALELGQTGTQVVKVLGSSPPILYDVNLQEKGATCRGESVTTICCVLDCG